MHRDTRLLLLLALFGALTGCVDDDGDAKRTLRFPQGFRWGVASAAHQIEGGNTNNNWYQFETLAQFDGKVEDRSGQAADSWRLYDVDSRLAQGLGIQDVRFSIEWSRIEPQRGLYSEAALAHYDEVLDSIISRGMRPVVTLHHFTDPIWVNDLRQLSDCRRRSEPLGDANLCGWKNKAVADAFVAFVERVAKRYAGKVDVWMTFNEPMAPVIVGNVYGLFPPGDTGSDWKTVVLPMLRNMIDAHARAYAAIKRVDTVDADGDGKAAQVGFSQSVSWYEPADPQNPDHVAAADQGRRLMNYAFVDGLQRGALDTTLDGTLDEPHPDWKDKLDFIGLQYYYRSPTVKLQVFPKLPLFFVPCLGAIEGVFPNALKLLKCPAADPAKQTLMGYEHNPRGLYEVARRFDERYPQLPLLVSENGISTRSDVRRIQSLVRHLEWVERAIDEGIDIRGYYYWSLVDNFEWAEGYTQFFGLYRLDHDTFARTPTAAVDALRTIVLANALPRALRVEYGGGGALAAEPAQ